MPVISPGIEYHKGTRALANFISEKEIITKHWSLMKVIEKEREVTNTFVKTYWDYNEIPST